MSRRNALFDIFCVLQSAADIASRAAQIQARNSYLALRNQVPTCRAQPVTHDYSHGDSVQSKTEGPGVSLTQQDFRDVAVKVVSSADAVVGAHMDLNMHPPQAVRAPPLPPPPRSRIIEEEPSHLSVDTVDEPNSVILTASKVPSSRIGRLFHYGSLAVGLSAGAVTEMLRRTTSSTETPGGSLLMSPGNVARLVDKLTKMRGAALKLGQFMSIQDSHILPEQLEKILQKVQSSAHYMPNWQMEQVMSTELGPDWKSNFATFDPIPFASASIGQVHRATLSPHISPSTPYRSVAVKVQFPNVKSSIHSDLRNLSLLLHTSRLLPRGLFLDSSLAAMATELDDECNYIHEANAARRFGSLLEGDTRFDVMGVVDDLSTANVLTMQQMEGVPIVRAVKWSQAIRDEIGTNILTLCLRELFRFRFMQTDPNWSNFLYNPNTRRIELIDFGASREYSKQFMDDWYLLLRAATLNDASGCHEYSLKLGYLTGDENQDMLNAHIRSLTLLGHPFNPNTPQPFSFDPSSQDLTSQIRDLIPVMLKHRLTPPPRETYSLNRKLSGAFLLCGRLGARVDCRNVWEKETEGYQLG